MTPDVFAATMRDRGWVILPEAVDRALIRRLTDDVAKAHKACREIQVKNGVDANTDGSAHHVLALGGSFLEFLESQMPMSLVTTYFGGKFIVNSFGSTTNVKGKRLYSLSVHRDIRFFSRDIPLMLNMLVTLDDFTLENGATYVLAGSHRSPEKPDDAHFFSHADRAVCKAGSILLFNSNMWHAAGDNTTDVPRQALTITLTKPFLKQQFDYCRALGYDRLASMSDQAKQLLGYNARVAANLDEWYRPLEDRMFKPDQD